VITKYLQEWRDGNADALSELMEAIYVELRRVAAGILKGSDGQTVEPTVLVHEFYFRLPGLQAVDWQSRAQFLNVAARVMRNILVDYARRKRAAKRGGDDDTIFVRASEGAWAANQQLDILLVHELLERLAAAYPRQAQVVELRFFGGLTEREIADVLKLAGIESSERTVTRDWVFSRAWLQRALQEQGVVKP
jgi:RNA polymerase sigma factor (TIGR02999 family)